MLPSPAPEEVALLAFPRGAQLDPGPWTPWQSHGAPAGALLPQKRSRRSPGGEIKGAHWVTFEDSV